MDNLDDLDNNAKISDSAYSNSYSNSESRKRYVFVSFIFNFVVPMMEM